jgi:hypothetical protein
MAQAAWLWRSSGRVRALFCLGVALVSGWLVEQPVTLRLVVVGAWYSSALFCTILLLPIVLYVAGNVFLLRDLKSYVARTEGGRVTWSLGYVWAIFTNVFYFQHKFHELYGDQAASANLTRADA